MSECNNEWHGHRVLRDTTKIERVLVWRKRMLAHPYCRIVSSSKVMWYTPRIGEMIRIQRVDIESLWAREDGQYGPLNVVHYEDVEWVPPPGAHSAVTDLETNVLSSGIQEVANQLEDLYQKHVALAKETAAVKSVLLKMAKELKWY